MLPNTLNEWTLPAIKELVRSGYQESESVDFKAQLPHPKAMNNKAGLVEDCCAFANSSGGFLVFGILDAKDAVGEARLAGTDAVDFQSSFGNYPSACQPSVDWRFRETPVELDNGRLVQVVYIPASWRGPHACTRDEKWVFVKRTNKGNENMSYDEIRLAFLHNHDRMKRAFLLIAELEEIRHEADEYHSMIVGENTNMPARFDLSVLDGLWSDIYPIMDTNAEISDAVVRIRRLCRTVNRNADAIDRYSFRGEGAARYLNRAKVSNGELLEEIDSVTDTAVGALRLALA